MPSILGYKLTDCRRFQCADRRYDEDHWSLARLAVRRQAGGLCSSKPSPCFLSLVGTTLSCINTGARVTYAMGRDDEVPSHFGMLHGKNLTPHRAIWMLADHLAVIGIFASSRWFTCAVPAHAGPDIRSATPKKRASGIPHG